MSAVKSQLAYDRHEADGCQDSRTRMHVLHEPQSKVSSNAGSCAIRFASKRIVNESPSPMNELTT